MANVVELIKADHRAVEDLFAQYNHSGDPQCALKICEELTKHSHAEEAAVYYHLPEDIRSHSEEEHTEIKELIQVVQSMKDDLAASVAELEEKVTHHVKEEESKALPALEAEPLDLESMGQEFTTLKNK